MHHDDVEIEPGVYLGEFINQEINKSVVVERNGFFPDQVKRVAEQLQADRSRHRRYVVEIPWISLFTAFTTPGRFIYFSRRLIERCPDDECVAYIIAHEIAHHDLEHFRGFQGRFARRAMKLGPGALVVLFFRALQSRIYKPEWEAAADLRAIELCVRAGYDGNRCIAAFDVLEKWALYHGDYDAIYGPDRESDQELSPEADLMTRARIWLYLRRRGYLPIQDRRAMVRAHLKHLRRPIRHMGPG
jgi:predicted Zn-dependent protease